VYITHKSDKQKKQAVKVQGDMEDTGSPLAAQPVTMRRGCNIKLNVNRGAVVHVGSRSKFRRDIHYKFTTDSQPQYNQIPTG
jgi:hypothetical protein